MFTLLLAATLAVEPASAKDNSLTGTVLDDAGKPLANATVFIRTARPRVGVGVL